MTELDTHKNTKRKWTPLDEEVVNVIIQTQSRTTRCGPCLQRHCCDSYFRRKSLRSYYWNTGGLAAIFLIMFVVFLIWLVVPFLKTLPYEAATCRTRHIDDSTRMSCQCGEDGCSSYYPCLVVRVRYTSKHRTHRGSGMLHDIEFGGECSFAPPCSYDEEYNKQAVWRWRHSIESGRFSCFYDPTGDYIMRAPRLSVHKSVHLLLWPGLAFLLCVVGLVVMCCTCGCRYPCMSKPSPHITTTADGLLEKGTKGLGDLAQEERETLVMSALPNQTQWL